MYNIFFNSFRMKCSKLTKFVICLMINNFIYIFVGMRWYLASKSGIVSDKLLSRQCISATKRSDILPML